VTLARDTGGLKFVSAAYSSLRQVHLVYTMNLKMSYFSCVSILILIDMTWHILLQSDCDFH